MPRLTAQLFCTFFKNFPKKYIEKEKGTVPKKIFGNRFGSPDKIQYEIHPDEYSYKDDSRPWEMEAKIKNKSTAGEREKGYWWINEKSWSLEKPYRSKLKEDEWYIFRGDRVMVMVGKDKGKQGVVQKIIRELDVCFVKGLNCTYKEVEARGYKKQLILVEKSLNFVKGEVQLVDPEDSRPTDVEWKWNENGERIRISVRSKREIQIPSRELETFEYKRPSAYKECSKDTLLADVTKITYEPVLNTFEQNLVEEYGILEDEKYQKTFWY